MCAVAANAHALYFKNSVAVLKVHRPYVTLADTLCRQDRFEDRFNDGTRDGIFNLLPKMEVWRSIFQVWSDDQASLHKM
jgi:hypothetical protein